MLRILSLSARASRRATTSGLNTLDLSSIHDTANLTMDGQFTWSSIARPMRDTMGAAHIHTKYAAHSLAGAQVERRPLSCAHPHITWKRRRLSSLYRTSDRWRKTMKILKEKIEGVLEFAIGVGIAAVLTVIVSIGSGADVD